MKTMKKLTLNLLIVLLSSCASSSKDFVMSLSDLKWGTTLKADMNNALEHGGTYHSPSRSDLMENLIFYKDGTFCFFQSIDNAAQNEFGADVSIQMMDSSSGEFGEGLYGIYQVRNDTIVANVYDTYSYLNIWDMITYIYIIHDKKHIELAKRTHYSREQQLFPKTRTESKAVNEKRDYYFTAASNLPTPNTLLKKEKWMWNSITEWQEYQRSVIRGGGPD